MDVLHWFEGSMLITTLPIFRPVSTYLYASTIRYSAGGGPLELVARPRGWPSGGARARRGG